MRDNETFLSADSIILMGSKLRRNTVMRIEIGRQGTNELSQIKILTGMHDDELHTIYETQNDGKLSTK